MNAWAPDIAAQTAEAVTEDGRAVTVAGVGHAAYPNEADPSACGRCGRPMVAVRAGSGGVTTLWHLAGGAA